MQFLAFLVNVESLSVRMGAEGGGADDHRDIIASTPKLSDLELCTEIRPGALLYYAYDLAISPTQHWPSLRRLKLNRITITRDHHHI